MIYCGFGRRELDQRRLVDWEEEIPRYYFFAKRYQTRVIVFEAHIPQIAPSVSKPRDTLPFQPQKIIQGAETDAAQMSGMPDGRNPIGHQAHGAEPYHPSQKAQDSELIRYKHKRHPRGRHQESKHGGEPKQAARSSHRPRRPSGFSNMPLPQKARHTARQRGTQPADHEPGRSSQRHDPRP